MMLFETFVSAMPPLEFGMAVVPVALVPMKLPVIVTFPPLKLPMPANALPETTLPLTMLLLTTPLPAWLKLIPLLLLASAALPDGVTPM